MDGSPDMLAQAREKAADLTGEPPVFLNQDMTELDLYGTVDAAVCCLDSLNYLLRRPPPKLHRRSWLLLPVLFPLRLALKKRLIAPVLRKGVYFRGLKC